MKSKFVLLLAASCLLSGCEWRGSKKQSPTETQVEWPLGTVLVSRNNNEDENTSPGHWNHLAIYIGNRQIVESQKDQGGVILTPWETYAARDYTWFPLFPIDEGIGTKAAEKAKTLIGLPYSELSSLLRVDRNEANGLNCVSVVRVSYVEALGHSLPKLKTPDNILEMTDVFTKTFVYKPKIKVNKAA